MKKLLFQSDDFGITNAVSQGILHGIKYGLIRNTGLFVNMPSSRYAVDILGDTDVCLGIDINYVCGRPVSNPDEIPDLINELGYFNKSGEVIKRNKLIGIEKGIIYHFEKDPFPYDQILIETENQVKRFIEITGKLPEYLHPHSVCTPNTEKAATVVAKKYGIFHTTDMMFNDSYHCLPGAINNQKGAGLESQISVDVEKSLLTDALPEIKDGEVAYFICHCGYVDYELFQNSSLTLRRVEDLHGAESPSVINFIEKNQINLITYRDFCMEY